MENCFCEISDEDGVPPQWVVNQWKDASDQEKNEAKQDWENKQSSLPTP